MKGVIIEYGMHLTVEEIDCAADSKDTRKTLWTDHGSIATLFQSEAGMTLCPQSKISLISIWSTLDIRGK